MYNNELYHFGIKGMKWGVRKKNEKGPTQKSKRHLGINEKGNISLSIPKLQMKLRLNSQLKLLCLLQG